MGLQHQPSRAGFKCGVVDGLEDLPVECHCRGTVERATKGYEGVRNTLHTNSNRRWLMLDLGASGTGYELMSRTRPKSKTRTFVTAWSFLKLYCSLKVMKEEGEMEARLQAASTSGSADSTISVQMLDDLIVPKFCWLNVPEWNICG